MTKDFTPTEFKIWYIHQIPCQAFERIVDSPKIGAEILDIIYELALFQFDNGMIPDYANAGGILYMDQDGDWIDYDPEEWEQQ